jgi:hypothetical protein
MNKPITSNKFVTDLWSMTQMLIEEAVLAEREACAEVCKKQADVYAGLEQNPTTQSAWAACIDNRDAIRARDKYETK